MSIKLFLKILSHDQIVYYFCSMNVLTTLLMAWRGALQNVLASFCDWIPTTTMWGWQSGEDYAYLQKTGSNLLGGLLRVTYPAWQEKVGQKNLLPGASSSLLPTLTLFNQVQTEEKLTPHQRAPQQSQEWGPGWKAPTWRWGTAGLMNSRAAS